MNDKNSPEQRRRKPGIQSLPEERKRGVTIRFLPEMKDDIYDLRDWIEREGAKGKKLLGQILKHEGKIDELLAKLKAVKKEDEAISPPVTQLKQSSQPAEIEALKLKVQQLEQESVELKRLQSQVETLKNLFGKSQCRGQNAQQPTFTCVVFDHAQRVLNIHPHQTGQR